MNVAEGLTLSKIKYRLYREYKSLIRRKISENCKERKADQKKPRKEDKQVETYIA